MANEMITATTDSKTAEIQWTRGPAWTCPQCHSINAGHRETCRICSLDSALLSGGAYFPILAQSQDKAYGADPEPEDHHKDRCLHIRAYEKPGGGWYCPTCERMIPAADAPCDGPVL